MDEKGQAMNRFLVQVFNEVLRIEEVSLAASAHGDLSLKELHVIDAVQQCVQEGDNSASSVALRLGVTAGTLTTAVNLLIKKGYLVRRRDERDGRIKRISLTVRGEEANRAHLRFHEEMVRDILSDLTSDEAHIFARGLDSVGRFFQRKYGKGEQKS